MIVRAMRDNWVIAAAVGAVLALAAVVMVSAATETARGQDGAGAANFTVTAGQLRINQRISQAAVRRSNESLTLLDPIRDRDGAGTNDSAPGFGTAQIAAGAVTQAKLGADVTAKQPLWAVVNPDGSLVRASGATASGRAPGPNFGAGVYTVTFNRNVTGCAYVSTIGSATAIPPTLGGQILTYLNPNTSGQVLTVRTFSADGEDNATPGAGDEEPGQTSSGTLDGDEEDRGFQVVVTC